MENESETDATPYFGIEKNNLQLHMTYFSIFFFIFATHIDILPKIFHIVKLKLQIFENRNE